MSFCRGKGSKGVVRDIGTQHNAIRGSSSEAFYWTKSEYQGGLLWRGLNPARDEAVPSVPGLAPGGIVAEVAFGFSRPPRTHCWKARPCCLSVMSSSNIHMNTENSTWSRRKCGVRRVSHKGGMVCAGPGLTGLTWDGARARTIW